jgi:predicted DNA-binding transcriptional regulator AlpA
MEMQLRPAGPQDYQEATTINEVIVVLNRHLDWLDSVRKRTGDHEWNQRPDRIGEQHVTAAYAACRWLGIVLEGPTSTPLTLEQERQWFHRLLNAAWARAGAAVQPRGDESKIQYVSYRTMASMVGKSRKTLDRWQEKDPLPTPEIEGGKGRPNEYDYQKVRAWLERHSNRRLPPEPYDHMQK